MPPPAVRVTVVNRSRARVPASLLRRAARAAMGRRGVTVAVLGAREMARLNWRFLRHRGATDVLAFPPADVAVCPAVARREASARGLPWRLELARYVVHGCLHLRGYDDRRTAERERMWRRQERLVAGLA